MNDKIEIYKIPEWNLNKLNNKIAALNKRAANLDCPAIEIIDHGTEEGTLPNYQKQVDNGIRNYDDVPHYIVHNISISGAGPRLAGWKFVGTLDHHTIPGSIIVNTVPGEHVPGQFYHNDAKCDHCGKIRQRVQTFVVEHDSGEFKQIGRQCLKDFLGHNPKNILRLLTSLYKILNDLGNEDGEFYEKGDKVDWSFDKLRILEVTSAIIRTHGWVSRSASKDRGCLATADYVFYYFCPPIGKEEQHWDKWAATIKWDKEADTKDATDAIKWLTEQNDSNNEYLHNLKTIANADMVSFRLFGYWCSLLSSYQKSMERLRFKAKTQKLNEWIGEPKERMDFEVEVVRISHMDGHYGVTHLHKMLDSEGRTLIWFASTSSSMESGHKYKIKGTIKKHDKFNEWKQTLINRVKVLEEIN